jgi:hypothetical protein
MILSFSRDILGSCNLIYKVEIVGMFVCMFACSSRRDKPICTKLGILIPWDQKENIGR